MAKMAEGLRPFKTPTIFLLGGAEKNSSFFTFVCQTIDCLGQFDMPGCECLCSVVAIALGTKSFGAGVRSPFWEKLFFPVFYLSYLTTPPLLTLFVLLVFLKKKSSGG